MTFDPVDMDIRNHAHKEGVMAAKEAHHEYLTESNFKDFLDGENHDLYEELGIWFEEDNEPDNEWLRKMLKAHMKRDKKLLMQITEDMMGHVMKKAEEIAQEQATDEMED